VLAHLGHDVDATVDDALAGALARVPWDLINGAVGIGVYALERMPESSALLAQVIGVLDAAAVVAPSAGGLDTPARWLGPDLRARHSGGACDLGVAHGQGAAIALAGAAAAWGVANAHALHTDLRAHLWSVADDDGDTAFPAVAGGSGPRRSGWCYGDPGSAPR